MMASASAQDRSNHGAWGGHRRAERPVGNFGASLRSHDDSRLRGWQIRGEADTLGEEIQKSN